MEAKYIIISIVKSNNSENNVWAVAITGEEKPEGFCKSAYKAMRFAFLLKKRTGVMIDDASLRKPMLIKRSWPRSLRSSWRVTALMQSWSRSLRRPASLARSQSQKLSQCSQQLSRN